MHDKSDRVTRTHVTRRAFLTWVGAFSTGAAASYWASQLPPVRDIFAGFKAKVRNLREVLAPSESVRFHYGGHHYLIPGIPSDNTVTGDAMVRAVANYVEIDPSDDPSRFELDERSDWVLVGGPSSDDVSARLLQFEAPRRGQIQTCKLPLRFSYTSEEKLVRLERYTASGEWQQEARRHGIVDTTTGTAYRPEEGGSLDRDYLLITRLPPVKNVGARTIIGGTHGLGTRGVALLLENDCFSRRQLKELERGIGTGFQILALVDVETERNQTIPVDLKILNVVGL